MSDTILRCARSVTELILVLRVFQTAKATTTKRTRDATRINPTGIADVDVSSTFFFCWDGRLLFSRTSAILAKYSRSSHSRPWRGSKNTSRRFVLICRGDHSRPPCRIGDGNKVGRDDEGRGGGKLDGRGNVDLADEKSVGRSDVGLAEGELYW